MLESDFNFYQKILLEKSGLALNIDKSYLLDTRLTPIAQSLGYSSLDAMTSYLKASMDPVIIKQIVETMTTNETSFFRDIKPFNILRDTILPYIIESKKHDKNIRIWSAACSSGQEAYSIAMTIAEMNIAKEFGARILGTDISDEIVKQAQSGIYNQFEIQRGLSIQQMLKYFTQVETNWQIKNEIKVMTQFRNCNLLDIKNVHETFDIIFCRNVLIYFNQETKLQALQNLAKHLAPNGVLVLGACETVMGMNSPFEGFNNIHGFYTLKKEEIMSGVQRASTV